MLLKACIILVNVSILKTQSILPSFCMGDVCYIRVESSSGRDWTEAQQACLSSGSTLPIVDNSTHQKSFEAAALCLTIEDERKLGIWIGAKAYYSNPNNWTWLDGSNYLDTRIESQKDYGMTYAFVQNTSTGVRAYASYPIENHSHICHYPTGADMCKNGTEIITVENGCFVKFNEHMSWFSARNACLTNDGDLASFKNISLLDGKIGSDGVWVGLRSSQWNWQRAVIAVITGSSSDVTVSLWNSGEPNDNAPSCISTDEGDKFPNWRDYNCSEPLPFICQSSSLVLNSKSSNCVKPSTYTAPRHTLSSSLRSWTTKSSSAAAPSVASTGDKQQNDANDTGSVNTALAVGLGVGIGVPVILVLVIIVIVISVRRKRRNSNAGGNSKSRETVVSKNSKKTRENNRMEMSETQNGQPHYDNFSAASQYATIPASTAAGPKLDPPSTQGTVYADLSFNQAGPS